jgi:aspartate-semialdehyde dehydrogenase
MIESKNKVSTNPNDSPIANSLIPYIKKSSKDESMVKKLVSTIVGTTKILISIANPAFIMTKHSYC